jgi:asparagine synthase (glutamine-hydrolysing)
MCGIAGEIALERGAQIDLSAVAPMASVLAHRGPDGWGFYIGPNRSVSLVNLRLAIVDIANGHQPISNENKTVWVTLNGEIYGFADIRRDLESREHRFATDSDTEVIVHLYEEYGEDFVHHLSGEFAFALHDERASTTYLVRDRFGIKPLFYARDWRRLVFASEIKSILRHPSFTGELRPEAVYRTLCAVLAPSETIFKGIGQVEPGTYLKVRNGHIETRKYWSPPFHAHAPANSPDQQSRDAREFRELLTEAVRVRRHGDVPAGVYLSGGLDSTAVATLLSRSGGPKLTAFTVAFDNPQYDELGAAGATAKREGLRHRVVQIHEGDLARHFSTSLWHSEIPVINTHGTAKFLLSKLARTEVKVVLTGEGADELLEGYDLFTHLALLEERQSSNPSIGARHRLRKFLSRQANIAGLTKVDQFVDYEHVIGLFGAYPYQALRTLLHAKKLPYVLSGDFQQAVRAIDPLEDLAAEVAPDLRHSLSSRKLTQLLLFRTQLPNYLLNYLGDRQEMAHSVEARLPFLDHKLVEFVIGRCPSYPQKRLLRLLVSGQVNKETATAPKKMFLAPSLETLAAGGDDNPLDQYLRADVVRQAGIFSPAKLWAIRKALPFIPKQSYQFTIAEALLIGAASLHIVDDLFCRNFERRVADAVSASPWGRIAASPTVSECSNAEDLRRILA